MKNVLLVALNAHYIHASLPVRSLRAAMRAQQLPCRLLERSINDAAMDILCDIAAEAPDLVGFSCYIWNIALVETLCGMLRAALPDVHILLGGPEVSFDAPDVLARVCAADAVLCGEAEQTLPAYVRAWQAGERRPAIDGLCTRSGYATGVRYALVDDLNALPDVYAQERVSPGQMIYYEGSRGCPFCCGYCLSAGSGVRALPIARVKRELARLDDMGVRQVKLVDRTFNADPARARELFAFLIGRKGQTSFHCEVAGHLLDEQTVALLKTAPRGRIRLEVGVQSTNAGTIAQVARRTDFARLSRAVRALAQAGNVPLHLDLIAGLPGEDMPSFARSFDAVMDLGGDVLQLGFLKLLKGSALRARAGAWRCRYSATAPYEVLATDALTFAQLAHLHDVEDMLERYGNAKRAPRALALLRRACFGGSHFALYSALARYWRGQGYGRAGRGEAFLYEVLARFGGDIAQDKEAFLRALALDDYARNRHGAPPAWCPPARDAAQVLRRVRQAYRQGTVADHFPHLARLPGNALARATGHLAMGDDIYIFDYSGACAVPLHLT
nr:B12-binding domain-containing radical SAM protein [Maliibacterium massiliense]